MSGSAIDYMMFVCEKFIYIPNMEKIIVFKITSMPYYQDLRPRPFFLDIHKLLNLLL